VITRRTTQSAPRRQICLARLIFAAAVAACDVSATGAAEQPAASPPGKKLYESKCLRCHKDLDPTIYEDMTWKKWLWKMKDKARLDNEEYGDLSDYLKGVREAAKSRKQK
jgi:cytochrome c5